MIENLLSMDHILITITTDDDDVKDGRKSWKLKLQLLSRGCSLHCTTCSSVTWLSGNRHNECITHTIWAHNWLSDCKGYLGGHLCSSVCRHWIFAVREAAVASQPRNVFSAKRRASCSSSVSVAIARPRLRPPLLLSRRPLHQLTIFGLAPRGIGSFFSACVCIDWACSTRARLRSGSELRAQPTDFYPFFSAAAEKLKKNWLSMQNWGVQMLRQQTYVLLVPWLISPENDRKVKNKLVFCCLLSDATWQKTIFFHLNSLHY